MRWPGWRWARWRCCSVAPRSSRYSGATRAFAAGLDYFVLELLVLGLVFIPLEGVFSLHEQRAFRAGWQTDLKHFFVSHAGVQLLSFAAMIPAQALFAWAVQLDFQRAVAAQPLWLQFLQMLLLIDLATYWVHRAFHARAVAVALPCHPPLEHRHGLAGRLAHASGGRVDHARRGLRAGVRARLRTGALYAYLVFVSFHAVFIHANLRWRFPGLRWLIATPEFHHWHHASDDEGIDKNFAAFLPLWDRLFGTAHLPAHWPRRYGTTGAPLPEGYLGPAGPPLPPPLGLRVELHHHVHHAVLGLRVIGRPLRWNTLSMAVLPASTSASKRCRPRSRAICVSSRMNSPDRPWPW
jgi:sterol desaturase/sphingolipid hydroxylase (fatty acid hydroxylase superfamily)